MPNSKPSSDWSRSKNSSRFFSLNRFESFTPSSGLAKPARMSFAEKTAAAATTGPANGPRPTSSTPAIRVKPLAKRARSCVNRSTSMAKQTCRG